MKRVLVGLSFALNFALVFLLFFSLYWSRNLKHNLAREHNRDKLCYEAFINASTRASRFVGLKFPKVTVPNTVGQEISTDFSEKQGGIVLLFSTQGCQPCLTTQLKMLQYIMDRLNSLDDLPIYVFSNTPPVLLNRRARVFDLGYSFVSDTTGVVLRSPFSEYSPIVFFVNPENTIAQCHVPVRDMPHLSALFYNELQPYLELSKPLFTCFKGCSILSAIRNEFDAGGIMDLLY